MTLVRARFLRLVSCHVLSLCHRFSQEHRSQFMFVLIRIRFCFLNISKFNKIIKIGNTSKIRQISNISKISKIGKR